MNTHQDHMREQALKWEKLKLETLSRMEEINRSTPFQDIEPAWWLHMMKVYRSIKFPSNE